MRVAKGSGLVGVSNDFRDRWQLLWELLNHIGNEAMSRRMDSYSRDATFFQKIFKMSIKGFGIVGPKQGTDQ